MTLTEAEGRAVHALATTQRGKFICGTQAGLKRSSDHGDTWHSVGAPSPTTAICITDDGHIMAAAVGATQISDDDGETWITQRLPSTSMIVSAMLAASGSVLAATLEDGVLRSDDGGRSWRGWNFGLLNWRVNTLCRDSQGVIWAGTEGGLFRSDTDGRSWQDQADFANSSILSLDATAEGRLWLGTTEGALHSRGNPQADWKFAQQWQRPTNAICTIGERIAVLHGQTVSFSDGESRFEALSYSDVTSMRWLDKLRLLIGTNNGLVHSIDVP